MARYTHLKAEAERYAAEELGWRNAEAVDAKPAGRDGRATAVLIDCGARGGDAPGRFVIAFDEWDEIATDAGFPDEFGWEE